MKSAGAIEEQRAARCPVIVEYAFDRHFRAGPDLLARVPDFEVRSDLIEGQRHAALKVGERLKTQSTKSNAEPQAQIETADTEPDENDL